MMVSLTYGTVLHPSQLISAVKAADAKTQRDMRCVSAGVAAVETDGTRVHETKLQKMTRQNYWPHLWVTQPLDEETIASRKIVPNF